MHSINNLLLNIDNGPKTDQLPLLPEVTENIISLTYFDSFHSTTQIYIYHKEKETKGSKNDSHAIVHI